MSILNNIPDFLNQLLIKEYDEKTIHKIIDGYKTKRATTLRVNTLKTTTEEVKKKLNELNITYEEVSWYQDALIIKKDAKELTELELYKEGHIYLQSLSSMIPPLILEPKEEMILDMTASPGSKTTQIAALTNNNALITAVEKNKIRLERLNYNIQKLGAKKVQVLLADARTLNESFSFDKILLDAPCSGSGTLSFLDESFSYFNEQLIQKSVETQEQLLKKAIRLLKPGQILVYSTCSILKEENEEIISKVLKEQEVELVPIDQSKFKDIEFLPVTIEGTMCICPNKNYEGFFIAKLKKIK